MSATATHQTATTTGRSSEAPTGEIATLLAPRPSDAHPSSGLGRVVVHLVLFEIGKLAEQFSLEPLDDVDEERYTRAIAPLLRAMRDEFGPGNLRPRESELRRVRSGIRELERWRRKPTEAELREVVDKVMGIERVVVTGADAQARRVVSAGSEHRALPAFEDHDDLSWVRDFPRSGSLERDTTLLRAIKNVDDPASRRNACIAVAAGYQRAKSGYKASILTSLKQIPEGKRLSYYLRASRKLRARRAACGHLFWRTGVAAEAVKLWQRDRRAQMDQQFAKLLGYGGK
jgi:hypothetical protein